MSRISLSQVNPELYNAMLALARTVGEQAEKVGVEAEIQDLIKIRASQVNGCAFCVNMHTADARKRGMTDQRIDMIVVWREAGLYSERECAALALTEAITYVHDGQVPDEVWQRAARVFPEDQLAVLVWAAIAINGLNRVATTSRNAVPPR